MDTPDFISLIGTLLSFILALCFVYRIVYFLIGLFGRSPVQNATHQCRYGVLISARNEEAVISDLIHSIQGQDYPSDLVTIFVIADNCTDHTASAARNAGAHVYERFNRVKIGKGYALNELLQHIEEDFSLSSFDGFFVFDADNILEPNYITEMNRIFNQGYRVVTSYRNSKNFGANWISAGYGLWFLREARFLNYPRMKMGISCAISGTGFLVSAKTIRENGGWPYHLLTEDIEFSVNCALKGQTIGYCDKAVIYDEQPIAFKQSWDQRLRWSKGFYQVDYKYGLSLIKGCFSPSRKGFSCYDMFMTVAPGMLLTLAAILVNLMVLFACMTEPAYIARLVIMESTGFIFRTIGTFYIGLLLYGAITMVSEWDQIHLSTSKKLLYTFTFPLFMFTYIPISACALVRRVEWKPIYHGSDQGSFIGGRAGKKATSV